MQVVEHLEVVKAEHMEAVMEHLEVERKKAHPYIQDDQIVNISFVAMGHGRCSVCLASGVVLARSIVWSIQLWPILNGHFKGQYVLFSALSVKWTI